MSGSINSKVDIDALLALHRAATPGRWFVAMTEEGTAQTMEGGGYRGDYEETKEVLAIPEGGPGEDPPHVADVFSEDDRSFIILARRDIPALCEEVQRLRKLEATVRDAATAYNALARMMQDIITNTNRAALTEMFPWMGTR